MDFEELKQSVMDEIDSNRFAYRYIQGEDLSWYFDNLYESIMEETGDPSLAEEMVEFASDYIAGNSDNEVEFTDDDDYYYREYQRMFGESFNEAFEYMLDPGFEDFLASKGISIDDTDNMSDEELDALGAEFMASKSEKPSFYDYMYSQFGDDDQWEENPDVEEYYRAEYEREFGESLQEGLGDSESTNLLVEAILSDDELCEMLSIDKINEADEDGNTTSKVIRGIINGLSKVTGLNTEESTKIATEFADAVKSNGANGTVKNVGGIVKSLLSGNWFGAIGGLAMLLYNNKDKAAEIANKLKDEGIKGFKTVLKMIKEKKSYADARNEVNTEFNSKLDSKDTELTDDSQTIQSGDKITINGQNYKLVKESLNESVDDLSEAETLMKEYMDWYLDPNSNEAIAEVAEKDGVSFVDAISDLFKDKNTWFDLEDGIVWTGWYEDDRFAEILDEMSDEEIYQLVEKAKEYAQQILGSKTESLTEDIGEQKITYMCDNCGYTEDIYPSEDTGACPNCHEHDGEWGPVEEYDD